MSPSGPRPRVSPGVRGWVGGWVCVDAAGGAAETATTHTRRHSHTHTHSHTHRLPTFAERRPTKRILRGAQKGRADALSGSGYSTHFKQDGASVCVRARSTPPPPGSSHGLQTKLDILISIQTPAPLICPPGSVRLERHRVLLTVTRGCRREVWTLPRPVTIATP